MNMSSDSYYILLFNSNQHNTTDEMDKCDVSWKGKETMWTKLLDRARELM